MLRGQPVEMRDNKHIKYPETVFLREPKIKHGKRKNN